MTEHDTDADPAARPPFEAARVGAFVDAVVAIAMTLLILPLMEGVGDVADGGEDTAAWFADHQSQLISFVISFAIIAMFWMIHHRLFLRVEGVSSGLMWMVVAWLLTIVWLPVATAISGQMPAEDPLAKIVYIGSMMATSLCSLLIRLVLARQRGLHRIPPSTLRNGMAADIAMIVLFGVALVLTLAVPALSYFPLFLMMLVGPLQSLLARAMGARRR